MAPHTPLLVNQPHSYVGGSIQGEKALHLSHMHTLYKDDNKQFYGILEEATHGTTYEAFFKLFCRASNERGDYLVMIAQHAGMGKWIVILRDAKTFVINQR